MYTLGSALASFPGHTVGEVAWYLQLYMHRTYGKWRINGSINKLSHIATHSMKAMYTVIKSYCIHGECIDGIGLMHFLLNHDVMNFTITKFISQTLTRHTNADEIYDVLFNLLLHEVSHAIGFSRHQFEK